MTQNHHTHAALCLTRLYPNNTGNPRTRTTNALEGILAALLAIADNTTPAPREATEPATGPVVTDAGVADAVPFDWAGYAPPWAATPFQPVATPFADSIRRDQAAERARLGAEFDRGFCVAIVILRTVGRDHAATLLEVELDRIRRGRVAPGPASAAPEAEQATTEPPSEGTDEHPEKSGPQNPSQPRDIATEMMDLAVDHTGPGGAFEIPWKGHRYQLRDRVWVGGSTIRPGVQHLPGVIVGITRREPSKPADTRYRVDFEVGDNIAQWAQVSPADLTPRTSATPRELKEKIAALNLLGAASQPGVPTDPTPMPGVWPPEANDRGMPSDRFRPWADGPARPTAGPGSLDEIRRAGGGPRPGAKHDIGDRVFVEVAEDDESIGLAGTIFRREWIVDGTGEVGRFGWYYDVEVDRASSHLGHRGDVAIVRLAVPETDLEARP